MKTSFEKMFITQLSIVKVRHLKELRIQLSEANNKLMKHLLLTGKNGSGKTSVLDALSNYLDDVCGENKLVRAKKGLDNDRKVLKSLSDYNAPKEQIRDVQKNINYWNKQIAEFYLGINVKFNCGKSRLQETYKQGCFILAYFKTDRVFEATVPQHIEKVALKEKYTIADEPRKDFIKYLVDKKVSQSLYQTKNELEKADTINRWFLSFEKLLRDIFEDDTLRLEFDVDTFAFHILEKGRERFDFNTMSSGYAAILDIVVGIIMRMEQHANGRFEFDMPGIVLIDEIETHLHYELQKRVLPFLCTVFPNIQFVVSTHSAFILNSIENAVIYDLGNKVTVPDGLSDVPYDGIIEGYFDVSILSKDLQDKYEQYKVLVAKKTLSDDELAEIQRLELYLDEIPDYLGLNIATEYKRLKLEFEAREDI